MNKNEVINDLNTIHFPNMECIEVGTASEIIINQKIENNFKLWIIFFSSAFINRFHKLPSSDIRHLIFFSPQYENRKDFLLWTKQLNEQIQYSCLFREGKKRIEFNVTKIKNIFLWYNKLRKVKLPTGNKLIILIYMKTAYDAIEMIDEYIENHKLVSITTICDVHCIDSLLVQYYKLKGIITISLQHGLYSSNNPITVINSKSNYLLVYGDSTKKLCLKLGMNQKKIKVLGMPKLINFQPLLHYKKNKFRSIGIVFDGNKHIDNDINMFKFVKSMADKRKIAIMIKLHPGTPLKSYQYNFENIKFFYDDITVEEFMDGIDILIVGGSTVFIESMIKLKPVFIYSSEQRSLFPQETWCSFKNDKELEVLIDFLNNNYIDYFETMIKRRENYTVTNNVKENYIDFYKRIIQED